MYEFEKYVLQGKNYQRDNGGTCYLFPNVGYYNVFISDEMRAKGYQVFSACVDLVTITREHLENISDKPALGDRDIVTVVYQFATRAKTRRGIIDAAARRAYDIGAWCYIPACISGIWGPDTNIVKDIKFGAYSRLER